MGVYNVAPYIRDAVRSALQQSVEDIEVIVVDDGSTDGTPDLVCCFGDPRLRLIQTAHRGAAAALNRGVAEARSRYIAFLDGDDIWLRDRLERHLQFMELRVKADLTFSLSRLIEETSTDLGLVSRSAAGPLDFNSLFVDNIIGNGSAIMVRREALSEVGPFDETLPGVYDFDVWLRIARRRKDNICCIPEVLTLYRRRPGQITKNWRLMASAWRRVMEKFRAIDPQVVSDLEPAALCNMYRYLAAAASENGDWRAGADLLALSFRAAPSLFLRTHRSYLVAAVVLSAWMLPPASKRWLERRARDLLSIFRRAA